MILVILPNQLFELSKTEIKKYSKIYLVEHPYFFTRLPFHKLKLAFLVVCMKHYYNYLVSFNKNVIYIKFENFKENLIKEPFNIRYPIDKDLVNLYDNGKNTILDSSMFLFKNKDLETITFKRHSAFYNYSKNYIKNEFNIDFTKLNYLDKENRKRIPKDIIDKFTDKQFKYISRYHTYAINYINTHFKNNPGDLSLNYLQKLPFDFKTSKQHLYYFLYHKLFNFGKYQDFISKEHTVLFHSNISFLINVGLLSPLFILKKLNLFKNLVNKNEFEGFLRQIIGWREYMHYIYYKYHNTLIKSNFWNNTKKMSKSDWNVFYGYSKSGIDIIDTEIQKIKKTAWSHHIIRLMVFLNYFVLKQIRKEEIYTWFISFVALDAYDWVMVSNIYSMGYYCKSFTSKPYISSSNYLIKMSDYPKDNLKNNWDPLYKKFMKDKKALKFYGKTN